MVKQKAGELMPPAAKLTLYTKTKELRALSLGEHVELTFCNAGRGAEHDETVGVFGAVSDFGQCTYIFICQH